jgi:hypothetical protein
MENHSGNSPKVLRKSIKNQDVNAEIGVLQLKSHPKSTEIGMLGVGPFDKTINVGYYRDKFYRSKCA